jgi:hypothetical protein
VALERLLQLLHVRAHAVGDALVADVERRVHAVASQIDAKAILSTIRALEPQHHLR